MGKSPRAYSQSRDRKIFDVALELTDKVRQPAGSDPRFSNPDSISKNMNAFIEAYNRGMGDLHARIIGEMFNRERKLRWSGVAVNKDQDIRLYRRVNDAIVWTGLSHRRHLVKALCSWSTDTRPVLGQANPKAVLTWMASVDVRREFPVWTDTTSFIGPGDVILFGPSNRYRFVELKQIGSAIISVPPNPPTAGMRNLRKFAHQEVGQSAGDKIVDRLTRQVKKMGEADRLMKTGKGKHPFTQVDMDMLENDVPEAHYGEKMTKLIEGALNGPSGTDLIEGCVWVAAYPRNEIMGGLAFLESARMVFTDDRSGEGRAEFFERTTDEVFSSRELQGYPIVKPPPILPISRLASAALLTQQVTLLSYLDWDAFADLVNSTNVLRFQWTGPDELAWLTTKESDPLTSNNEKSMPIKTWRGTPTLVHKHYRIELGPPTLFRILGDFVLPSTIVEENFQPNLLEQFMKLTR